MDNVKFFNMVKNAIQLGFDGHSYLVDIPDGECHIVYMEQTLCGKSRERASDTMADVQSRWQSVLLASNFVKTARKSTRPMDNLTGTGGLKMSRMMEPALVGVREQSQTGAIMQPRSAKGKITPGVIADA